MIERIFVYPRRHKPQVFAAACRAGVGVVAMLSATSDMDHGSAGVYFN